MIALSLSILCSTAIVLLFKAFERNEVDNFPAIVINYLVCVLTGGLVFGFEIFQGAFWQQPWFPTALLLGSMFIIGFQLIARCVQQNGITVATLAGKLSLVIPAILAFPLYGDSLSFWKISGLILAVLAVFFSTYKPVGSSNAKGGLLLPIIIWLIGGSIETILNYAQVNHLSEADYNGFLIFLFGTAFSLGAVGYLVQAVRKKETPGMKNVIAGILLGIPNYGSIYFLILALEQEGWESSVVFPTNNIGIILVSALLAAVLFKERLSKVNLFGLLLAVVAIGMMLIASPALQ